MGQGFEIGNGHHLREKFIGQEVSRRENSLPGRGLRRRTAWCGALEGTG